MSLSTITQRRTKPLEPEEHPIATLYMVIEHFKAHQLELQVEPAIGDVLAYEPPSRFVDGGCQDHEQMVPAGYMAKRVAERPDWLRAERVSNIYSVSGCVSKDFADYIDFWKHNGYWLFDSPEIILEIARENSIDLTGTALFFYEVYELQFGAGGWVRFEPEAAFRTNVRVPETRVLEGWDVVNFCVQTSPECSPLSCDSLAADVETNARCLLQSFEEARVLLENGTFDDAEPGPYRIFAVYSVAWPATI